MRIGVGVMCRVPDRDEGKTRLRKACSPAFVADLQAAMLADTLATLASADAVERIVLVAPLAGADALSAIGPHVPNGWGSVLQHGDDLGARIIHAFSALRERRAERMLVTGSDAPMLAVSAAALRDLAEDEVLLLPSEDGGYAAIAVARIEPRLFTGMTWSTNTVAEETRRRAHACGLRVRELPPTYDVDEPDDIDRLRRDLRADPSRAPRTARVLLRDA